MTDAPEQIWWNCGVGPYSFASSVKFAGGAEYIRADVARAMVAAAYEAAAKAVGDQYAEFSGGEPWCDQDNARQAVLSLTPDDASAALDRMMAERATPKVKPLVWEAEKGWRYCGKPQGTGFAGYCKWVWADPRGPGYKVGGIDGVLPTLEAAKAAAQADYERRIREALE